ncbi:MAG: ABC transporter permease [Deltaproteobacteria bacterium]|nr:ABC transporter permease [Deltaproteobacteria bacterium]
MSYTNLIGLRYLRSKKKSFISVITVIAVTGVMLGVAALAVVMAITTGFQQEFKRKVLGVNAHVLVLKYGTDFSEYGEVMQTARRIRGVTGTAPFVINEMMILKGSEISGVLLKGIDPNVVGSVLDLPGQMTEGSLGGLRLAGARPPAARELHREAGPEEVPEPASDPARPSDVARLPGIVLGHSLAKQIGARVGDQVRVISPLSGLDVSLWAPGTTTPKARDFRVIGTFNAGFDEYDTRLVYVDLFEAQRFYDQGDVVTGVELKLRDMDEASAVAEILRRKLGDGPYQVIDWEELNHNLFTALRLQKLGLSFVLTLVVVVAAFNVIGTLVMVVLDKKKEIAILKAMGTPDLGVLEIFLLQGTLIGVVGTALGVGLGLSVCFLLRAYGFPLDPGVYLIDHLPVEIDLVDFVVTGAIALVTCVGATIPPAIWAARLLPVDGLRYE